MTDPAMTERRTLRRRALRLFKFGRRSSLHELAGPPARRQPLTDSASSPAGRPARDGLARGWLEFLVVSFAFGGCIHNIHPDYVEFLHDLARENLL
jgi:hypothetical protein